MGDGDMQELQEDVEALRATDPVRMSLPDEDFDRFLEMLERSDPHAFRELIERDWGWAQEA